jgi:predicted RNA polymerase sigma factor
MLPDDREGAGLLALMVLTDARRPARSNADGELVPLDEQDRTRWDQSLIAEGVALVDGAVARGAVGEYQLQAAIAAVHDRAARVDDTDWPLILALYGLLEQMTGNPVVSLNRAVAAAMVHGPAEGLMLLEALDERLAGNHRLDAVRAHLFETAGDARAAVRHYRAAASRTTNVPEQRYLTTRPGSVAAHGPRVGEALPRHREEPEIGTGPVQGELKHPVRVVVADDAVGGRWAGERVVRPPAGSTTNEVSPRCVSSTSSGRCGANRS